MQGVVIKVRFNEPRTQESQSTLKIGAPLEALLAVILSSATALARLNVKLGPMSNIK